ncbi:DUF3158 family protein [Xanthomonas citri pv. citri]|nr:DUF3158 family protein [Xanthomonas citri]QRD56602.1 DUF3158 family protein [Xanthomonas citri pv. citri]QRD58475.1 DUF3158 family protein [Xanthomonas citri pv. citri]QRD62945.1 DUF3158 family protein [Xanthomonas citri pv. citri]QRD71178.1 DUF3158 family protein [Xanthomonas citri pv. citri]UVG60930.1 DUF3158 family protein [Xanthomonas citri pv. durantae]
MRETAPRPVTAGGRFVPLEQADFRSLRQAASLKGLLQPFKGKGPLEAWASECHALRDDLMDLAQQRILAQANQYPFLLLPIHLALQNTGAGTGFLRWRRHDRSAMGVALWRELMESAATPHNFLEDLHAIEVQRVVINMQVSLLHTLGRQARDCAVKLEDADAYLLRRHAPPADRSQP